MCDRLDRIHDQAIADALEGAEDHHVADEFRRQRDVRVVRMEERASRCLPDSRCWSSDFLAVADRC